ncbi:MAG: hypothetical protein DRG30_09400 [Epsilonproteobacteria bacterium]|nr:MAG: hypothetical protein DRG30_09400 [Campylobacterota bacterium]
MIKIIKIILYEPLFHFIILGGVVYLYFNLVGDAEETLKERVEVTPYETQKIKLDFKKSYNYDINPEQLRAFKARKIYEKIALSEAYALGLDRQDEEIASRLLKRMNFIMINTSEILEPSEEELLKYYKNNLEDYSKLESISFSHVYFVNVKDVKIKETFELLKIAKVTADKAAYFGNVFKPSNHILNINYKKVEETYGKYFAYKLFNLKKGLWHEGVHSKYGLHLVYVTSKNVSEAYDFDEVQDRVYEDYKSERLRERFETSYDNFKSKYSVIAE